MSLLHGDVDYTTAAETREQNSTPNPPYPASAHYPCSSAHIDGKSSSPKTNSSSESSSFSGKRPFFRRKLLASRIIGSRILRGNTPLSEFVFTIPVQTSLAELLISPLKFLRTASSHSLQESSPCFASGT